MHICNRQQSISGNTGMAETSIVDPENFAPDPDPVFKIPDPDPDPA